MPAEIDYKALVDKKFTDWEGLFTRHKDDADLFNLVKLNSRVLDVNDREIANSIYIVLDDLAYFAFRVESVLNSAIEQVAVTSDNKRFDVAYVEGFIRAAYKSADKLLALKGKYLLNPFLDQQNFRRGSEAVRFYFHIEKGELIPDIQLWDTGYFVCAYDNKGIAYTGYKMTRSSDEILTEYPEAKGKVKDGTDIEALYILARDTSELWISKEKIKELPNRLGYVPVVYRRVPIGSMLMDSDSLKYQGESGIYLLRDLVPELNRFVSIIQSLNLQELDHALQRTKKEPTPKSEQDKIPTVDELNRPGSVNEVGLGEGYTKMPIGELRAQAEFFVKMVQDRIDRAGLMNFQTLLSPKTATEILALSQEQDVTTMPRLANRGLLKQDGAGMIIKQVITECEKKGVGEVKLGGQTFEVAKLKGEYDIQFKYSFKDPSMDAARQSLAVSQRGLRPDGWILRNTLMSEDPEGEERMLSVEEAARLSPLVKLRRTIVDLLEEADRGRLGATEEAKALTIQYLPALKQAMAGMMTPKQAEEVQPTQLVLPVLAQTAGGGRRS